MSDDLISRSVLLEEINNFSMRITGSPNAVTSKIVEKTKESIATIINEQPTAYDMDKVIDAVRFDCYGLGMDESSTEIIVDDIKSGGINKSIG